MSSPSNRAPGSGTNMLGVTKHRLSMSTKTLATLKGAIETACNVPDARKTWAARGRAAAAAILKGIRSRLMGTETEHVKISVHRTVDLSARSSPRSAVAKKKRVQRSGRPTGWPKTKAERDAWYKRRAERAARGELVGRKIAAASKKAATPPAGTASYGPMEDVPSYVPTAEEHTAFLDFVSRVARSAGVDQSKVTTPVCRVSMSAAGGQATDRKWWWRPVRSGGGAIAHFLLSVEENTPVRRFRSTLKNEEDDWSLPMSAGDALCFPANLGLWECPGEGDFVLELAASIA